MRNFQDTFETRKRSFTSAFSICMTVPLISESKVMILSHFDELSKLMMHELIANLKTDLITLMLVIMHFLISSRFISKQPLDCKLLSNFQGSNLFH